MSPERRANGRVARRVDVRFWRRGAAQSSAGFTTNVSTTGLFLGTSLSLVPGERLRLEVGDRDNGFAVEGVVVRVHRVAMALRQVMQPGAGVRFLLPDELVAGLVPGVREAVAAADGAAPGTVAPPEAGPGAADAGSAADAPAAGVVLAPVAAGVGDGVVVVEFPDRAAFLSAYHRDLAVGSLFVSTGLAAAVGEAVTVEIHPPAPCASVHRFAARVVQRFEPDAAVGGGRNVLAGIGVRFDDPAALRESLAGVLAELRR
jgi:Tfp pilus assembly protein PilZ